MKKTLAAIALTLVSCASHAVPIASFTIDGNTWNQSFSITNNSDANEDLTRVFLDISPTHTLFDTVGSSSNAKAFTPRFASDTTTGLVSPSTVDENSSILEMIFSDFNPGETFFWDIDVDRVLGSVSVFGNDLVGSEVSFDFSNGQQVFGVLASVPHDHDASRFHAMGVTDITNAIPEPSSFALLFAGIIAMGYNTRRLR
ncbi:MAG: PEP-CTERM sorting domain-containing protein [Granulosicoccus sp.]